MNPAFLSFLIAALVLLGMSAPAEAQRIQWFVDVKEDPISKRPLLEARVITAEGYRFRLWKRKDNSVWGEFTLPRGSRQVLTSDRLPQYRVDRQDPVDLEELKDLEIGSDPTLWKLNDRMVQFIVWGSVRDGFIPPTLRQMMLGKTLFVRYFTLLGEESEAEITLRRANQAIAQFLRVRPLDPKDEGAASDETFSTVAKDFQELCDDLRFTGDGTDYTECRRTFVLCSEQPDQTVETFKQCLGLEPSLSGSLTGEP